MRIFRISLAAFALLCLAGWLWLRQPYSPTQDLPAVSYTAFEVMVPNDTAGSSLARAAHSWKGVTASTYNPTSGLLVVSHTAAISEKTLQSQLQILTPKPITKKVFPEPIGPKCPVPKEALAALPGWFLGAGIVLGLGFVLLTLIPFLQRRPKTGKVFA